MANIDHNSEDTHWMAAFIPKDNEIKIIELTEDEKKQIENNRKAQVAIKELKSRYNESCDFDTSSDWAKALMATDKISEQSKKTLGCQLSRDDGYTSIIGCLNVEGLDTESMMDIENMMKPENQAKIKQAQEGMKNSLQNNDEKEVDFISDYCCLFGMVASKKNLISILNSPFVKSISFDSLL